MEIYHTSITKPIDTEVVQNQLEYKLNSNKINEQGDVKFELRTAIYTRSYVYFGLTEMRK